MLVMTATVNCVDWSDRKSYQKIYSLQSCFGQFNMTRTCGVTGVLNCKFALRNIHRFFLEAKIENFIGKNLIFFNIFAQNIHCGYT